MKIRKYKIRVDFEVATADERAVNIDALAGVLNQLFNVTVKMWAKDNEVLVTPTRTTTEGNPNNDE